LSWKRNQKVGRGEKGTNQKPGQGPSKPLRGPVRGGITKATATDRKQRATIGKNKSGIDAQGHTIKRKLTSTKHKVRAKLQTNKKKKKRVGKD